MPNPHIFQRLTGLQIILNGIHQSSVGLSAATIGQERAAFIDEFLAKVLPPIYRFGTGDVTNSAGAKSGQLDVVLEHPFGPSLPVVGSGQTRLYLAESVAAVIEVKSNLAGQWQAANATADALASTPRTLGATLSFGNPPSPQIPLFAVGYRGWASIDALTTQVTASPNVTGALVIDPGLYASKTGFSATGPLALWGLICDLHYATVPLLSAVINPVEYAT
ncbi:hypothetical protein ACVILI_003160 [Mesorhizobium sp. USDA 4775]